MKLMLVAVLVAALIAVSFAEEAYDDQLEGDTPEIRKKRDRCDAMCSRGGCWGQSGKCRGICYCYGSGYSHRCYYCDA